MTKTWTNFQLHHNLKGLNIGIGSKTLIIKYMQVSSVMQIIQHTQEQYVHKFRIELGTKKVYI